MVATVLNGKVETGVETKRTAGMTAVGQTDHRGPSQCCAGWVRIWSGLISFPLTRIS